MHLYIVIAIVFDEHIPSLDDVGHVRKYAILDARHRRDNWYHNVTICRGNARGRGHATPLAHRIDVCLGVIFDSWRIARDHRGDGVEMMLLLIGVKQDEHSTIAMRHALELLER